MNEDKFVAVPGKPGVFRRASSIAKEDLQDLLRGKKEKDVNEDKFMAVPGKKGVFRRVSSVQPRPVESMNGIEFESYCSKLLQQNGFKNVRRTPASGDQGVDILAEKGGVRYAIQCKRYMTPVSNSAVQEVFAGRMLYGCDVAVVMTNSSFRQSAIELAMATNVQLWDGVMLSILSSNFKF